MKTKKCFNCGADINFYASACPKCHRMAFNEKSGLESSLDLDFFSLNLYQSTIDEITSEYVQENGKPDRILDTTFFSTGKNHFFHRFIFFGETHKLVFISPDKHISIPYNQIIGYNIDDHSFVTETPGSAITTTDTGSMLGRAAVGSVIGGATGALIGGSTASKNTTFERGKITNNPRFAVNIKTKNISNPIIGIDFEEHTDTLQQFTAILDILLNNQNDYANDQATVIEEKNIYLHQEIRERHPDIVSKELELEAERKKKYESGSGCMVLFLIPIIAFISLYLL